MPLLSLGPSAWGVSAITVTRQGEPEPRLLISKQGVVGVRRVGHSPLTRLTGHVDYASEIQQHGAGWLRAFGALRASASSPREIRCRSL